MNKSRILLLIAAWVVAGILVLRAAEPGGAGGRFSRTTIDIGVVVSDIDTATKFYSEALGFTKVGTFDVAGAMAGDTGLTDNRPFTVHVFAPGNEPTATKLKIMEVPGAGSKPMDNKYISSSLGLSYLTVFVSNLSDTIGRLKQYDVTPVKAPYKLGGDSYLVLVKDPDGNIIELIGPMD